MNQLRDKIAKVPVPLLPAMVGTATLSTVYQTLGFEWIRLVTMYVCIAVIVLFVIRTVTCFDLVKKEYAQTVPSSLYAAFFMILMILGAYFYNFLPGFGKGLWLTGLVFHAIHILVFTYNNVIKTFNKDTFVPSWFVTYNGILVSCVVGAGMKEPEILTIVVYYGIVIYFILIPCMIYRLKRHTIGEGVYHTLAVVLAPCSLCVVGYLNIIANPNAYIIGILYICVILSVLFIIVKIPKFFSYDFTPAFAGLTFPMAIGIVASAKMSVYLNKLGYPLLSVIAKEIQGIQLFLTTVIIGYVLYHFGRVLRRIIFS